MIPLATATATGVLAPDGVDRPGPATGGDLRGDDDASLWLVDMLAPVGGGGRTHRRRERYLALPSLAHPRYLVPLDHRRAAAAAVRPSQRPGPKRVARVAARQAAGLGALRLLARRSVPIPAGDPSLPTLREWLVAHLDTGQAGAGPIGMAVTIGPPRPNRKPILQLVGADGGDLAFGKLATNAHTAALVANEAHFLGHHRLRGIETPTLISEAGWKGHRLALLSPLALPDELDLRPLRLTSTVILEIAAQDGLSDHSASGSAWWQKVLRRAEDIGGSLGGAVRGAVDAVGEDLAGVTLSFGSWHGDLTPWNAAWVAGRLHVLDWERASAPVPLGLDAVHNSFSVARFRDGLEVADAARRASAESTGLLVGVGVPEGSVDHVVDAYLVELMLRLALDTKHGDLGPLGRGLPDLLAVTVLQRTARPAPRN